MSSREVIEVSQPKIVVDKLLTAVVDSTQTFSPLRRSARLSGTASPAPSEEVLLPKKRRRSSSSSVTEDIGAKKMGLRGTKLQHPEKISEETETQEAQKLPSPTKPTLQGRQTRRSLAINLESDAKTVKAEASPSKERKVLDDFPLAGGPQLNKLNESNEEIDVDLKTESQLNSESGEVILDQLGAAAESNKTVLSESKPPNAFTPESLPSIATDIIHPKENSNGSPKTSIPFIIIEEVSSPRSGTHDVVETQSLRLPKKRSSDEYPSQPQSKIPFVPLEHLDKKILSSISLVDTPTKNKTENGDNLRPVETVAKENTNSSILLKNNQEQLKGRRESNRFWKSSRDRFRSTIKSKGLKQNLKQRLEQKESLRRAKELEKNIKNAKRIEQEELRKRQEFNKQRREENAKKTEVFQMVKNPAKIKALMKKQHRQLEKRDVISV